MAHSRIRALPHPEPPTQVQQCDITQFHEITAGEADEIAPTPLNPDVVYGGRSCNRLDLKSEQPRFDPTLAFPDKYRSEWTLPLTWGRREHALYFGNQRIWRTADEGRTWRPVGPDLTRPYSRHSGDA